MKEIKLEKILNLSQLIQVLPKFQSRFGSIASAKNSLKSYLEKGDKELIDEINEVLSSLLPSKIVHQKLLAQCRQSLIGIFTKEELAAIIQRHNGLLLFPEQMTSPAMFLAGMDDFQAFGEGFEFYGASWEEVLPKLQSLGPGQVYALQEVCMAFWEKEEASLSEFFDKYS